MWDILIASDRIGGIFPTEARSEYTEWLDLYLGLYVGAALELGFEADDVQKFVRMVVKILDTANEWCSWDGTDGGLQACVGDAVAISETLLGLSRS
jgi:hypothetical protein